MERITSGLSIALACLAACTAERRSELERDGGSLQPSGDAGADATLDGGLAWPDAAGWFDAATGQAPSCTQGGDVDGDGFTTQQGDCNDCDRLINPGAFDFPGNDFDEDCSGDRAMAAQSECDTGLAMASSSAEDAARAIGLCKFSTASARDWGVIEARFTTADGSGTLDSPLQVGLLPKLGAALPRAGSALLALSSGIARAPDQPGYTPATSDTFDGAGHAPPAGFPKPSSVCPPSLFEELLSEIFNQVALELKIRVPTNARSLSFDSIFYSSEYPNFICQPYNDFFITLLEPHQTGDGNLVFDANADPIGVNTGLLAVCDPSSQLPDSPKQFECRQGTELLAGTGFGNREYTEPSLLGELPGQGGAATGWLTTLAPIKAGSVITLRFALWDTGDSELDSTVLIDRFGWSVEEPSAPTTTPTPVLL